MTRVENNEIVTTRLKTDKRVLFYFFPLKILGKYLMEGNVSGITMEEIDEILPEQIKEILIDQRCVRYKSTH